MIVALITQSNHWRNETSRFQVMRTYNFLTLIKIMSIQFELKYSTAEETPGLFHLSKVLLKCVYFCNWQINAYDFTDVMSQGYT